MKYIIMPLATIFFMACNMPQFWQAAEEIATDTAIKIEVSKEAIQNRKDLQIYLNAKHEDKPITNRG